MDVRVQLPRPADGSYDIGLDSAGDVYICGYRQNEGQQYPDDYLLQKISSDNGEMIYEISMDRDGTTDEARAIWVAGVDDTYVTGLSHTWDA